MRLLQKALTFDDVLLVPAYSNILPAATSLRTKLTRNISLNIPLLSAAMDTVTEARLAIAMAQHGGLGIIHKNMPIDRQAAHKVPTAARRVMRLRSLATSITFVAAAVIAAWYPKVAMALICLCLVVYLRPGASRIGGSGKA